MAEFKGGDKVQLVIKQGSEPEFGWGEVENGSVGIVCEFTDGVVVVDFPEQEGWMAAPSELTLLPHKVKSEPATTLSVGDKVKLVIAEGDKPTYGWGEVENGDVGFVCKIQQDGTIYVDFPSQHFWHATQKELQKVKDKVNVVFSDENKSKTKTLYAVVHKDSLSEPALITQDRAFAREVKADEGGKAEGWIILQYEVVKEIR